MSEERELTQAAKDEIRATYLAAYREGLESAKEAVLQLQKLPPSREKEWDLRDAIKNYEYLLRDMETDITRAIRGLEEET